MRFPSESRPASDASPASSHVDTWSVEETPEGAVIDGTPYTAEAGSC
ncbi:MAG: hypothetical protein ACLFWG_04725 [Longimicrobiales bacterium]